MRRNIFITIIVESDEVFVRAAVISQNGASALSRKAALHIVSSYARTDLEFSFHNFTP